jgi:hypothetical protein
MLAIAHCGLLSAACAESIINRNSGLLRRPEALLKANQAISGCPGYSMFPNSIRAVSIVIDFRWPLVLIFALTYE